MIKEILIWNLEFLIIFGGGVGSFVWFINKMGWLGQ